MPFLSFTAPASLCHCWQHHHRSPHQRKRKGMWMGGVPSLGCDVENRRLVPNERVAKLIRHIFQRFVELGSSTALVKELKLDGLTSKASTTQNGKTREVRPIDKGHIYKLLSNRTYLGELRHKDQ